MSTLAEADGSLRARSPPHAARARGPADVRRRGRPSPRPKWRPRRSSRRSSTSRRRCPLSFRPRLRSCRRAGRSRASTSASCSPASTSSVRVGSRSPAARSRHSGSRCSSCSRRSAAGSARRSALPRAPSSRRSSLRQASSSTEGTARSQRASRPSGAGIAGGYATLAAAAALYHLVPDAAALAIAAAIAGLAVAVSLAWGSELVAALGLVGAALAPALEALDSGIGAPGRRVRRRRPRRDGLVAVSRRWELLLAVVLAVVGAQAAWLVAAEALPRTRRRSPSSPLWPS